MLPKDQLFGTTISTLDSKNRVVIPYFTGVVPGDELIMYQNNDYLSLYDKEYFLYLLNNQYNMYNDRDDSRFLDKQNFFDKEFAHVMDLRKVDNQKRIILSNYIINYFDFKEGNLFFRGAFDHVNVFRDEKHMVKSLNLKKH